MILFASVCQNKARNEEISALKFAIKVINAYNLESEYPKYNLVKRIEKLEKKKFASASFQASAAVKTTEAKWKQAFSN